MPLLRARCRECALATVVNDRHLRRRPMIFTPSSRYVSGACAPRPHSARRHPRPGPRAAGSSRSTGPLEGPVTSPRRGSAIDRHRTNACPRCAAFRALRRPALPGSIPFAVASLYSGLMRQLAFHWCPQPELPRSKRVRSHAPEANSPRCASTARTPRNRVPHRDAGPTQERAETRLALPRPLRLNS